MNAELIIRNARVYTGTTPTSGSVGVEGESGLVLARWETGQSGGRPSAASSRGSARGVGGRAQRLSGRPSAVGGRLTAPARSWAQAVACAGGRIVAVGTDDQVMALAGPRTQVIDAGGRLVLPGLIDAHVHFLRYAISRRYVDLHGVVDLAEVRRRVREAVRRAAPGEWVVGLGWEHDLWSIGGFPTRELLDDIAPHNPVALYRMDMHTLWVNSRALELAGITRETPDPPESRIERDASGEPTGILREWSAVRLVQRCIPEPDEETRLRYLREAIAEAHRLGLTGIHDQRVEDEGGESFRAFQILRSSGELKLRVHANVTVRFLPQVEALGLLPGFGDDRLWLGHVKLFADGTLGSRTALMLKPFEGESENRGIAVTPADEMWEIAARAARAGFPLSIHAIGDQAVRNVMDVLSEFREPAKNPPGSPSLGDPISHRHRIEHLQLIHPADLERLPGMGVVASMQPVHIFTDWRVADRVWGRRARYAYAFRSLLDRGARLAFGSDAPVASLNPMLGIYAAVTRQDEHGAPEGGWYPQERLSVAEAVHAYTLGAAYAAGKEHLQGSITPGKWADLIVLARNIFEIPPPEIREVEVDVTIFAGEVVYERL